MVKPRPSVPLITNDYLCGVPSSGPWHRRPSPMLTRWQCIGKCTPSTSHFYPLRPLLIRGTCGGHFIPKEQILLLSYIHRLTHPLSPLIHHPRLHFHIHACFFPPVFALSIVGTPEPLHPLDPPSRTVVSNLPSLTYQYLLYTN